MVSKFKARLTITIDRAVYKIIKENYLYPGHSFSKFLLDAVSLKLKEDLGIDVKNLINTLSKEEDK